MAPISVLKGISNGLVNILKGAPYNKEDYEDLFKMMYELFQLGRRNGMIALEEHVMNPDGSSLSRNTISFIPIKEQSISSVMGFAHWWMVA